MKKQKRRNCWAKSWSNVYSIALCHIEERGRGAMITKQGKQIYDEDLLISWVPFEFFAHINVQKFTHCFKYINIFPPTQLKVDECYNSVLPTETIIDDIASQI